MSDKIVLLNPLDNVAFVSEKRAPVRHLILILHGIFSISDGWQELQRKFEGRFEDIEVEIRPISYEMMGILNLFFDLGFKKRKLFTEKRILKALSESNFDFVSIQCHSNGTKLFSNLSPEIHSNFRWIFFAGSICHMNDDLKFEKSSANLINDCGIFDIFPILAASLCKRRFGHTGVIGFNNPPARDRFFNYGHSQATRPEHFLEWIIPILLTSEPIYSPILSAPRSRLYAPSIIRLLFFLMVFILIILWTLDKLK